MFEGKEGEESNQYLHTGSSPPFLKYKDSMTVNTKGTAEYGDQSTDHHHRSSYYNTSLTPSVPTKMREKHSIERIDKMHGRNSGKARANATYLGFDRNIPIVPI